MYNTTFEPFIINIYCQEALYKDTYNQLNTESFVWLMLKTMPLTTRASRQTLQDPVWTPLQLEARGGHNIY